MDTNELILELAKMIKASNEAEINTGMAGEIVGLGERLKAAKDQAAKDAETISTIKAQHDIMLHELNEERSKSPMKDETRALLRKIRSGAQGQIEACGPSDPEFWYVTGVGMESLYLKEILDATEGIP
jgi:hypothetical protein